MTTEDPGPRHDATTPMLSLVLSGLKVEGSRIPDHPSVYNKLISVLKKMERSTGKSLYRNVQPERDSRECARTKNDNPRERGTL